MIYIPVKVVLTGIIIGVLCRIMVYLGPNNLFLVKLFITPEERAALNI